MTEAPLLLAIVELGGYPDFSDLYRRAGYRPETVTSMRKALARLKSGSPALVVAEFNFQSDFRDRTSSLESLLATLQARHPQTRLLVFYEPAHLAAFDERVRSRWRIDAALPFPIDPAALERAVAGLKEEAP